MSPSRPPSLSRVLGELAHGDSERLSLDHALDALGDRSSGGVILFLTLVAMCLPPGLSAIPGVTLAFVSGRMLLGRNDTWAPRFVRDRSLDRRRAGRLLDKVRPTIERVERHLKPRWPRLLRPGHMRLVGLGCLALSAAMIVPIPFVHSTAGLGLIAFSAGLLVGDGAALLAGWGMTAACGGVVFLLAAIGHGLHAHFF